MKTKMDALKNRLALLVMMMMASVYTFAQEKGLDVAVNKTTTTTSSSDWYTQPWVWIVGGLVFVLLLAAMLSGGRSTRVSDGTVTRTTITRRDDVLDA